MPLRLHHVRISNPRPRPAQSTLAPRALATLTALAGSTATALLLSACSGPHDSRARG